MKYFYRKLYR